MILLLAACGYVFPEPAQRAEAEGEAPSAGAARVSTPEEAFVRWRPFLEERFGAPIDGPWAADLDGDGARDLVVAAGGSLLLFRDTSPEAPTTWEVLLPGHGPVGVGGERPAEAAGEVLSVGGRAPIVLFWHREAGEPAWVQPIPAELAEATAAARAKHPAAFDLGANHLLGPKGFDGEAELAEAFVGDFDGDGALELVVLEAGVLHRDGASTPLDYPARRGLVAFGPGMPGTLEGEVAVPADRIDLWVPEASSISVFWKGGELLRVWTGD